MREVSVLASLLDAYCDDHPHDLIWILRLRHRSLHSAG